MAGRDNPSANRQSPIAERVASLLARMTLAEKIGQLTQVHAGEGNPADYLGDRLRAGLVGSVINQVDAGTINELQRIAVEESRLGIPLLIGRDVIHGYRSIQPIPLGQAATWNPGLVQQGARAAALEAVSVGINWTFAPMIDVARDPRWGRIAESFGECVFLTSAMAVAMVQGFQGDDPADTDTIAACAKHFAAYGAVESGRDYATTNVPESELRNVYLPPFRAAVDAGVMTLMPSFSDLNGIPASGNEFLLRQVLRNEWGFDGLVVSDWDSVRQLKIHGLTASDCESAEAALTAGVDMEMAGDAYLNHLADLVEAGRVSVDAIDAAVANVLRAKFRLGLFDRPVHHAPGLAPGVSESALATARKLALQGAVLLKNEGPVLPLDRNGLKSVAVIGPLADAPYEQLGTWIFDGDVELSVTPLQAVQSLVGDQVEVSFVRAMENSRSRANAAFDDAVAVAADADVTLLFLGEESILSGEAHSRADIDLPGDQVELVKRIAATDTLLVAVILAGRPLTLGRVVDHLDAILYAWHPGSMGGPAIADLLFGQENPSGKLPATFPRVVGQIPLYYSQKNTGKPPLPDNVVHIDDIDTFAPQTSFGMSSFHLDTHYTPLFPFGHGLSYTDFTYDDIRASKREIALGDRLTVSVRLTNTGTMAGEEVVQLYIRDLAASLTRPVRELKGFRRVRLEPGQTTTVSFEIHTDTLAFHGRDMQLVTEPGEFHAWIGGSSDARLRTEFCIVAGR
jgi:beta-glucosidase